MKPTTTPTLAVSLLAGVFLFSVEAANEPLGIVAAGAEPPPEAASRTLANFWLLNW